MLHSCCVCLKIENSLSKISINNDKDNLTLATKLSNCVPEVVRNIPLFRFGYNFPTKLFVYFKEWDNDWLICINCTSRLKTVYEFRELCLKTNAIRCRQDDIFTKNENSEEETIGEQQECKEYFICFHCNEAFDDKAVLSKHIENTHRSNKRKRKARVTEFTCDDCAEIFKTSKKLIEHAMEVHRRERNTIKPFKCDKCDGRFASSSNLVQHTKYHEGLRTNVCSYCGKGFITTSDLINHEKQHLNRREYKCKFCLKTFNTHKDLRSHTIIKHKDPNTWNYQCEVCNKRFHIKPNYDSHMRRHVGDKPFSCQMCQKSFVTKDELRKHMTSHTNVRAFQCATCGKEYKDKRVLDIHMAKVHGVGNAKIPLRIRKHLCNICPKAFYDKNKLMRHLCTHSGERPFGCSMCEKRFTDKSYAKYHMKTAHKIEDNQQEVL